MARKFFEVSCSSLTAINLQWGHCWFASLVICIGCSYLKAFELLVRFWLKLAIEIKYLQFNFCSQFMMNFGQFTTWLCLSIAIFNSYMCLGKFNSSVCPHAMSYLSHLRLRVTHRGSVTSTFSSCLILCFSANPNLHLRVTHRGSVTSTPSSCLILCFSAGRLQYVQII